MPVMEQSNWQITYEWSRDSGLVLGSCGFNGQPILYRASVPFVYVDYEGDAFGPFTDKLRSLSSEVSVREIMFGFDVRVSYDAFGPDYQYEHIWRFLADGQFGCRVVIHGPGEEIQGHHTYHIPFRYDLDVGGRDRDSFQRRRSRKSGGGAWANVSKEGRFRAAGAGPRRYEWRVVDKGSDRRVSLRPGQHDSGELWVLQYSDIEHWSSWGGAMEGTPGSPGSVPAVYANRQPVQEADLVLWYIAHVPSDELPTACGPWLHAEGFGRIELEAPPDHGPGETEHHHEG